MKILVMGGNRFCGKLVVEYLHSQGHELTVFNRTGTAPVSCEIIQGDRNDKDILRSSFHNKNYDCIIDMCLYKLEQAEKSTPIFVQKTKNYIFISSIAVYKKTNLFPIGESCPTGKWPLFEDYGVQKSKIENYLASFNDLCYTILRPTYVIGKNNHHKREGYYFEKILNNEIVDVEGDGQAILSFIFVEDLANIISIFATSTMADKDVYNICNDEAITITGFIALISDIIGKKANLNFVDKKVSFKNEHCFFSNKKIKNHLNYNFITLKHGLEQIYEHEYKIP